MGATELAARRAMALATALLAVMIVLVVPAVILRDDDRRLPGWYFGIVVALVGIVVVWGALAHWLGPRGLRVGAGLGVAAYAVFVLAFAPAALAIGTVGRVPWMLSTMGIAAALGLLAGGPMLATAVIVFSAGSAFLYRVMFGGLDLDGVVNDTQSVTTAIVICTLGAFVLSVSRGLDRAKDAAAAATALASTESGRLAARTRSAALVHDEVLATLTLAASDHPIPRDALARQAARAAAMLEDVARDGAPSTGSLPIALARAAREAGAGFRILAAGSATPTPEAEEALLAAARQALANSVRHAGDGVRREVRMRTAAGAVEVEVADDGRGFDVAGVGADRLGVATSILRRMRDVPGGGAEIASAPGEGTRVVLRWAAPAASEAAPMPSSPRIAIAVIGVVFLLGQGAAALAAAVASGSWLPPAVLVLLLVIAESLRRAAHGRVLDRVGWMIATAVAVVVVAGAAVVPFAFGMLWFVVAGSFLLVALTLLGRPIPAVAAQLAIVVAIVALTFLRDAPVPTIGFVLTRPLLLVGLAVLLHVVVVRMRRRAGILHRAAVTESGRQAWDEAARAELAERGARLRADVVPLLQRLAGVEPLTPGDRRACLRIEGALRDEYRAGGLVREPLTSAVRAARERGVDVLLLDDGDGTPAEGEADEIAAWMAPLVAAARETVVGRALPPGRSALATLTADGEATLFRGRLPRPSREVPL